MQWEETDIVLHTLKLNWDFEIIPFNWQWPMAKLLYVSPPLGSVKNYIFRHHPKILLQMEGGDV